MILLLDLLLISLDENMIVKHKERLDKNVIIEDKERRYFVRKDS